MREGLWVIQLPFVGELVQVRPSEQRWEGASERSLNGFGRRLLVPEEHYTRVSHYVDRVNSRGRLVYSRIVSNGVHRSDRQPHQQMLAAKVEVKPDTPFSDWLTHELVASFDYLCCETVEEFQQARRALSIHGQIKYSLDRHEKDDRKDLHDRTQYILGWNNIEKLAAIEANLRELWTQRKQTGGNTKRLELLIKQEQERPNLLEQLRNFDDYTTIDWHSDVEQIRNFARRKEELEQNADQLTGLRNQLAEIKGQIRQRSKQRDDAHSLISQCMKLINDYGQERNRCEKRLHDELREEHRPFFRFIEQDAQTHVQLLTLKNMDEAKDKINQTYSGRMYRRQSQQKELRSTLEERMRAFRNTDARIAQEVSASADAIPTYRYTISRFNATACHVIANASRICLMIRSSLQSACSRKLLKCNEMRLKRT